MILICLALTGFSSCCSKHRDAVTEKKHDFQNQGYKKAVVINYTEIAGCGWMLMVEDSIRIQPLNLAETFQKDSLKVWVSYSIKKDAVGICMAGDIVEINKIATR